MSVSFEDYAELGVAPYRVVALGSSTPIPSKRTLSAALRLLLGSEASFRKPDKTLCLMGGISGRVDAVGPRTAAAHVVEVLRENGALTVDELVSRTDGGREELLHWLMGFDQIVSISWADRPNRQTLHGALHGLHLSLRGELAEDDGEGAVEIYRSLPPMVNILFSDLPVLLVSRDAVAADVVAAAIHGVSPSGDPLLARALTLDLPQAYLENVALFGVPLEASVQPCLAVVSEGSAEIRGYHVLDLDRCTRCGDCERICPTGAITEAAQALEIDLALCIECQACVEVCKPRCLSPAAEAEKAAICPTLEGLEDWLGTLPEPSAEDSAALMPSHLRSEPKGLTILGLSILTMMEHAAALVIDGEIMGSVAEERFSRSKHFGRHLPGSPGSTLGNDLSLHVDEAFCWRAIRDLCGRYGVSLDDIDYFAINGIPARYRRSFSLTDPARPPRILRSGKLLFVPHHLAHAASAYRVSGFGEASIFTVDGSGDRATAAFFRADGNGEIRQLFDLPTMGHCSIGGVYETVTRILGFGGYGQGSTMALAGSGEPTFDMGEILSATDHRAFRIDYDLAHDTFRSLSRGRWSEIEAEHRNLAASLQLATEQTVLNLIRAGVGSDSVGNLCLAGGVALNCSMNSRLLGELEPTAMFVQPAANDAGTALGAALEAHRFVTGDNPECGVMEHAALGSAYDERTIEATLKRFAVPYERVSDIAEEVAQRLGDGKIVCWFQGHMEHGPRALGSRSILADPRRKNLKERLNKMKGRESWRPFGPSILSGREADYFEEGFHSPFMLFTVTVKASKREEIPVVVHVDGTTRPQSVKEDALPLYHAMLRAFERRSGVPLVVNTSFNTAHEPIVCSPADALSSFALLGADVLAMGPFVVNCRVAEEAS